ncbi:suppressor of lurcher protein 1-like [Pomacea canaliculata]|uniref:suppressor of lurcher protein 1-like n=1 Tax=Pomacea canaliculata TaxID=400727 RepID=UPI000D7325AE|nr:suppressor of lurcher protein 1-like [Pomacea canaliculata]
MDVTPVVRHPNNTIHDGNSATNSFRCGGSISSMEGKNGTISSPSYPKPYPPSLTCRFTFQGVGRERVQLKFVHFDLYYPSGDPKAPVDCTGSDTVSVYIQINGRNEALGTYCGSKLPPKLMSNSNTMTVEFRSRRPSLTVTGFLANYEFVTNFGIDTGQQDERGTCSFSYVSKNEPEGHIRSPNYPGLYPRNTECQYLFYGKGKERVHITFLTFDVDGIGPRCEENTKSDYVSFSNFHETEDRKLYRMCGLASQSKHKVESDGVFFRVTFKSNEIYDAHGFEAFYQFQGGTPTGQLVDPTAADSQPSLQTSPSIVVLAFITALLIISPVRTLHL